MKRRHFLLAGAGAGGALFFGWSLMPPRQRLVGRTLPTSEGGAVVLNGWLTIAADDTVTVVVPKAEMGQGIHTALAMVLAEELDCDWHQVRVVQSPIDAVYGNVVGLVEGLPFAPDDRGTLVRGVRWMMAKTARELGVMLTGYSSSVRDCWMPMREAGASARASLLAAAAAQWGVSVSACQVTKGVVTTQDGRSLRYGALSSAALAHRPARITLKDPATFTLIGQPTARLDAANKSRGATTYSIDVTLPNLRYAAVVMATFGATQAPGLSAVASAQVRAMAGVREVVSLPGSRFGDAPAIAVVADSWWQARQAANVVATLVTPPSDRASKASSADIMQTLRETAAKDKGLTFRAVGDANGALRESANVVTGTYEVPYLAHATMEPMNATVQIEAAGATLWTSTQMPMQARDAVAHVLNLHAAQVTVRQHSIGGGFGRRLDVDYIAQAAAIAKAVPQYPVQLIWSREDDMQHDFFRPASVSRLIAGLDAKGNITGFVSYTAGQAPVTALAKRIGFGVAAFVPDGTTSEGTWDQPYEFPTLRVSQSEIDAGIPVGAWRSIGHSHTAFAVESFLDEVAKSVGQDPVAYRAGLLASHPRALRVLQLAAEKAGWGTPLAAASDGQPCARGMALHAGYGSIIAQVAEVSMSTTGQVRVHRVVAAVDCGMAVNPNGVAQQIEGGIIFGLTAALYGETTVVNGVVQERNLDRYRLLRMAETPVIETHIVPSAEVPSGVGEIGVTPIAAAVANAVFALTGTRVRALPLRIPTAARG